MWKITRAYLSEIVSIIKLDNDKIDSLRKIKFQLMIKQVASKFFAKSLDEDASGRHRCGNRNRRWTR